MGLTTERLAALCRAAPAATVAYYSGNGDGHHGAGVYGELVVFAQNGRRASYAANQHGGNEVDRYAIEWLLRQRGPRSIITDRQFCGGPEGQEAAAQVLLDQAIRSGAIQHVEKLG